MAYLLEKRNSALPTPKKKRRMTMATFLFSSVESCEGGRGLYHHLPEEEVSPSSPKNQRSMTKAIILPSLAESCGCGHDISSREKEFCSSYP